MIYIAIYVLLFIVGSLIIFIKKKTLRVIGFIFLFMWTFLPILSTLGLYGLSNPSMKVHIIIYSSILCYILGFIVRDYRGYFQKDCFIQRAKNLFVNYKLIFFVNLLSYVMVIPYTIIAFKIINEFGYDYLRTISTINSPLFINDTTIHIIIEWFIIALYTSNILILLSTFLIEKKVNNKMLFFSITGLIIITFTFAARAILVKFAIYLLILVFVCKGLIKIVLKKKIILITFLFVFITIILITVERSLNNSSFLGNVVLYYAGPVNLFDYYLNNPMFSLMGNKLHYGSISFGFLYNIIPSILTTLFNTPYFGSDFLITQITSINVSLGNGIYLNAIPTTMYYFIMDFGFYGAYLAFFFFGYLSSLIEFNAFQKKNVRSFAVYIFFSYIIFKSIQNYELLSPQSLFVLIYVFLFTTDFKRGKLK